MRRLFHVFALALVLSLSTAPFGMAWMMEQQTHASAHVKHADHGNSHKNKAQPHAGYMVCAACIGLAAATTFLAKGETMFVALSAADITTPEEVFLLPPLPPPRA